MSNFVPPDLSQQEIAAVQRLKEAAVLAETAADAIGQWFPVDGHFWLFEGSTEVSTAALTIFCALRDVEKVLNPSRLQYGDPLRQIEGFGLEHPMWYLPLLTAFRALLHCHEKIVRHYGWQSTILMEDFQRVKLFPSDKQGVRSKVPSIDPACMNHARQAAAALLKEASSLLPPAQATTHLTLDAPTSDRQAEVSSQEAIPPSPPIPEKPDGTIESGHIWLKGKTYRFTQGLRGLLSYLIMHPGAAEDDVMRHCGFSSSSHLHKRLSDLRDKLAVELKESGWKLQIKTVETRISCEWRQVSR